MRLEHPIMSHDRRWSTISKRASLHCVSPANAKQLDPTNGPTPRPERDLSLGEGSMDQLSSSEGLAPRRWPIHRARLADPGARALQASRLQTAFHTG